MNIHKALSAIWEYFRGPDIMSHDEALEILKEYENLEASAVYTMPPAERIKLEERLAQLYVQVPEARKIVALYTERQRS